MIGFDKFYPFMDPACSLMEDINPLLWKALGVADILAAILLWIPKTRKPVAGIFLLLMVFFIAYHLASNTKDYGGAAFMAILLGLLYWNPKQLGAS